MEQTSDEQGNVKIILDSRDETLTVAYSVSEARGKGFLAILPFGRKSRLVRMLGSRTPELHRFGPVELSAGDSRLAIDALTSFSQKRGAVQPSELVHPESIGYVDYAAVMVNGLKFDVERH